MDYYITKMIPFHCKRGERGCIKCQALFDEGERFCLLHLVSGGDVARPVIEVRAGNKSFWYEFDFVECSTSLSQLLSTYSDYHIVIDPELEDVL